MPGPAAAPDVTELAKSKARKFFEHAKKSADTRNWDYAVKLYVNGLEHWPDAVEEGLKPLRVVATARRLDGGKSAGFLDGRSHSTTTKGVLKNLCNAYYLFGLDPVGLGPLEAILQNASKAKLIRTVAYIAPVLTDAYNTAKRQSESHYQEACRAMDAAADFAMALAEDKLAMDILNANISTAQIWTAHHPESSEAPRARAHASGKLTIVKGKFDKADGFEQSLKNAEGQRELMDRERPLISSERSAQFIAKARKDWEENRSFPAKLLNLVEMMTRDEKEQGEKEAMELLLTEYAASANYAFKAKADGIRIKQMERRRRELEVRCKADPSNVELQRTYAGLRGEQNKMEIEILQDRARNYPTDLRVKFQLAVRFHNARRFDEAIPLLQIAQADGRSRTEARLFMGRCFFEKQFYPQAIQTLRATLEESIETAGPAVLELNYWLGRSLEASGAVADAKKVYGQLIQLDYNYKDARQRLEAIVSAEQLGS